MSKAPNLTPAQLAAAAEKRADRLAKKVAQVGGSTPIDPGEAERRRFLRRDWVDVGSSSSSPGRSVRIVTWNVLAQTLLITARQQTSYAYKSAIGSTISYRLYLTIPTSKREDEANCMAWWSSIARPGFDCELTDLYIWTNKSCCLVMRCASTFGGGGGGTRQTKNIGLMLALEEDGGGGLIIATTHLFWHPKYVYERLRQMIILVRELQAFREQHDCDSWPIVLAGDLNTQPAESTYQLLLAPEAPLDPSLVETLNVSRLVHESVEKIPTTHSNSDAVAISNPQAGNDEEEEEEEAHGPTPSGTRNPSPEDGILTVDELRRLAAVTVPSTLFSAYGSTSHHFETFFSRSLPSNLPMGGTEPRYTCFTPLFRITLDYLLVIPPPDTPVAVSRLLRPPTTTEFGPGLPRRGVCPSDHIAMGCELVC